ncbi:MAG: TolC family protein, partial [Pantoea agglomerans]
MKPLIPFVVMLLGGCSVGPDYQRPAVSVPVHYKEARGWQQATPLDAQSKGEWWAVYHDATLSGLLNQVSISNQNVANYAAQYRQAQALASESRAALFPSLGYDGSATRSGSHATDSSVRTTSSSHQAELSASWEPDLWGKLRRTLEENRASASASAAELANITLSAQSELAQDYFQLRIMDQKIALYQQSVDAYQRYLKVI